MPEREIDEAMFLDWLQELSRRRRSGHDDEPLLEAMVCAAGMARSWEHGFAGTAEWLRHMASKFDFAERTSSLPDSLVDALEESRGSAKH